jgi:hypothetical protein
MALALVSGLLLPTHFAQDGQPADEVIRAVRAEMEKQHIPGLALLVTRRGVPIREEGFGLANVELNVPVKTETIFQSGSMGKQFTATAMMSLVAHGDIRAGEVKAPAKAFVEIRGGPCCCRTFYLTHSREVITTSPVIVHEYVGPKSVMAIYPRCADSIPQIVIALRIAKQLERGGVLWNSAVSLNAARDASD